MSAFAEEEHNRALHWEDLRPGQSFALGRWRLSAEDIIGFATTYDPQVSHVDPEAARTTFLGGLAASGLHSCAVLMRLLHDGLLTNSAYVGTPRIDAIRWQAPLRPDRTVTGHAKCLEKRGIADRPDWGVCEFQVEAVDAFGRSIVWWRAHLVFARRIPRKEKEDLAALSWRAFLEEDRRALPPSPGEAHMLKFFEDVQRGDTIAVGSYTFDACKIAAFAATFDPQPQRLHEQADPALPPASFSPGAASIWLIASAWMRCIADYYHLESARLEAQGQAIPRLGPSPGIIHARWHRPVCAGDAVTFRSWAERKMNLAGNSDWGLLFAGTDGFNEMGEKVVSFFPQLLLQRCCLESPVSSRLVTASTS